MLGLGGFLEGPLEWLQNREDEENSAVASRNFNADQATQAFARSQQAASESRDWQERMSNTAWQRGVADMKAAGLNPMLAYDKGGAGTPSGATASSSPVGSSAGGSARGTPTMSGAAAQMSQAEVNSAVVGRTKAETEKLAAEKAEIEARTGTHAVSMDKMRQEIEESKAKIEKFLQDAKTGAASAGNLEQQTVNLKAMLSQISATVNSLNRHADLAVSQDKEVAQRIKANLPEIRRAVEELEKQSRELQVPQKGMDAAVHSSFMGALSAVLRAFNPLSGLISSTR